MRIIVLNKYELEMGIKKESEEHGMSKAQAKQTAIDHLKERPDYYSVADKAGLEEENIYEWNDSNFPTNRTGGRLTGVKKYIKKHKIPKNAWVASAI